MKKTNRQKSFIITDFILNIGIFIGLVLYFSLSLYKSYVDIEQKKIDTKNKIIQINNINKNGLDITSIKNSKAKIDSFDLKDKDYISTLVDKIDQPFYNRNFINTGSLNYIDFLKEKINLLDFEEESYSLKKSRETLKRILPNYSEVVLKSEKSMTEFQFVNYLEVLFREFNISYNGEIGITRIVNYEDEKETPVDDLDSGIFYIPISFNLEGRKEDIINLIYYFENVGSINVNSDTLEVDVYSDTDFIKDKYGDNIVLSNDNKNIYENQFANISSIKMDEYIDDSTDLNKDKSLVEFVKFKKLESINENSSQRNHDYKITLDLRFYTVGVKTYKIKDYIRSVVKEYKKIDGIVNKKLSDKIFTESSQSEDKIYLKNLNLAKNTLKALSIEINNINKNLDKKGELYNLYKKISVYEKTINKIKFDLDLNEEEKK